MNGFRLFQYVYSCAIRLPVIANAKYRGRPGYFLYKRFPLTAEFIVFNGIHQISVTNKENRLKASLFFANSSLKSEIFMIMAPIEKVFKKFLRCIWNYDSQTRTGNKKAQNIYSGFNKISRTAALVISRDFLF